VSHSRIYYFCWQYFQCLLFMAARENRTFKSPRACYKYNSIAQDMRLLQKKSQSFSAIAPSYCKPPSLVPHDDHHYRLCPGITKYQSLPYLRVYRELVYVRNFFKENETLINHYIPLYSNKRGEETSYPSVQD